MRPPVASARLAALDLGRLTAAARTAADALERRYRVVLAVLLVAQWGGVLAIALAARHDGWLYHHGGDGTWYWTAAWELGHFRLPYTAIGYGYSFLLAPFGAIFGPSMLDGLPAALLLNTLVLLPLALLLLYGVAERIAGRLFGLFAAALWVVMPLLAYRGFRAGDARPEFLHVFLPGSAGLNMLGDFPSLVTCLAAAWFALRTLDSRLPEDAVLCGLLVGFAIGIKPANALFLPAPALAFLAARRAAAVLGYAAGLLLPLLALAVWKQRGLGDLPILQGAGAPIRLAAGIGDVSGAFDRYGGVDFGLLHQHMTQLRELFWSKTLLEWVAFAGSFAILRRGGARGLLVVVWFWAYVLVKGSSTFANVNSMTFFRFLEPAYPAFVLMAAACIALLLPRRQRPVAGVERGSSRRAVVAAAVVLGVLPLVLVAAARPAAAGSTVRGLGGVEIPVARFGLSARAADGTVHLTWRPRTGHASVRYAIYRTTAPDCVVALGTPGVPECDYAGSLVGTTAATTHAERAPSGRWSYRVAQVAGGDPLLLSEPVTLTVR